MKVTALLVSHDGARWLPAVLEGLASSSRLPDEIVAVDTGSTDASVALVSAALGRTPVRCDRDTSFGDSVRTGLASAAAAEPDEWVWLLHDDARPDPHCLKALLTVAAQGGDLVALGPKLREWPSLKRLLEVGVTISGSGRRETGLEPGEYDQGQYDEPRRVLAVNTAGMLVRRDVLERFGFDPALPLFGNDIDFGWRVGRAGWAVMVVPDAVMFHAEGAHRGRRRGQLAARPGRDERAAAMHILLANGSGPGLAWRWVRILIGGLLGALGHLLVRRPAAARDEMAALAAVPLRPGRVLSARRRRRGEVTDAPKEAAAQTRQLLAPPWMPLRHGLDFLLDLGRAVLDTAREAVHDRTGAGPERTVVAQALRSPTLWVLATVVGLSLFAGRSVLAGAALHGGALLPAPDGVGHWWSVWAQSWHWVGVGSAVSAPAYLLPTAVLGTLLLGQAGAVTWLLFVFTVPLAFWGATRLLRRFIDGRPTMYWAAAAYALLPVVSGAVSQGRLGTVVVTLLAPWLVGAALRLADPVAHVRSRAIWRTALGSALAACFYPPAWLVVPMVLVVTAGRDARRYLSTWWPVLVAPPVLLLPWWWDALAHPGVLLLEAGRAGVVIFDPSPWELLGGRLGGLGQAPMWFGWGLFVAGVIAVLRPDTRARVARAWQVALLCAVVVLVSSLVEVTLPGVTGAMRASGGPALMVAQGAVIVAVALAADGLLPVVSAGNFTWRQPVAAVAVVSAVAMVVLGAGWWVVGGTPGPLHRGPVSTAPVYMADLAASRPDGATLVVRGGPDESGPAPVTYEVLRADALRLGDDGIAALTAPDRDLTALVQRVLGGDDQAGLELASYGVAYVHAPAPVSDAVAGAFDATDGFTAASGSGTRDRAWRITTRPDLSAVQHHAPGWHYLLITIQALALIGLLVLAAPGRAQPGRGGS